MNYCIMHVQTCINNIIRCLTSYGSHPDGSNIDCGGLSECDLQRLGVIPRIAGSEYDQKECMAAIKIPVKFEASPHAPTSAADGNDVKVASCKSYHSMPKPVAKDVPVEAKTETRFKRETKEKVLVTQNCRKSTSIFDYRWWLGLVVMFLFVPPSFFVGANKLGTHGISAIVLSCKGPSKGKEWLSGMTPVVKIGTLNRACQACKHLSLTETGNVNITDIGERGLHDYQCELSPRTDAVQQFPGREFLQLCSVGNNSKFKEFLNINGGAQFELRRNNDSDWIYHFDVTNWNGILVMSCAQKVRHDVPGSAYCSIMLIKREDNVIDKNEIHALPEAKPSRNGGEIAGIDVSIAAVILLVCLYLLDNNQMIFTRNE